MRRIKTEVLMRIIVKTLVLMTLVAAVIVVLNVSSEESDALDCVENKVNFNPDEVRVYLNSTEIEPLTTINNADLVRIEEKPGYCNSKVNGGDYNPYGVVVSYLLRDSGILITAEKKSFSISFIAENIIGTSPVPINNIKIGDSVSMPEVSFSRNGYDMSGWNTRNDSSGLSLTDDNYDITGEFLTSLFPDGDEVILYPIWTAKNYSVSLNTIQGEITEVQWTKNNDSYTRNYTIESDTISLPSVVSDDRFHYFVCWEDQNGNTVSSIPNGSSGNISLSAVWALKEYTLSINVNGRTVTQTCTLDSTLDDPECEPGFSFRGWFYEDQEGNEKEFTSMSQMYEGMSLYAVFEPIKDSTEEMAISAGLLIAIFIGVMAFSFTRR